MEAVADTPDIETSQAVGSRGGKYLTFLLDGEEYGLEILKVREIINIMDITTVPQTMDFVEGVINLRGKVIPVVHLRSRFGLPRIEYNDQTCIIVVDVGTMMGIIVDTVREVCDIPDADIEPPPKLGGESVEANFILGMGKVGESIKILLEIDNVLMNDDFVQSQ